MKKIKLFKTDKGWFARFEDDVEVRRLFGTDIIPTAFTVCAPWQKVQREIQRLNPDCMVIID